MRPRGTGQDAAGHLTTPVNRPTIALAVGLVFPLPEDLKAVYVSLGIDLPKHTGHAVWELPMPARFEVDRRGIVRSAEVDPDYTVRPEPEATLAVLRAVA